MQAYNDIVPPSAVSHAISAPFQNQTACNLIVAKHSLLQIFEVRQVEPSPSESENEKRILGKRAAARLHHQDDLYSGPGQKRLILITEYNLSGTITGLDSVKAEGTKSGGHVLVVAFKSAKVALLEWDPDTFSVVNNSIHLYEGDHINNSPFLSDVSQSDTILSVDPDNRCVLYAFGLRNLAIIPFKTLGDDLGVDEDQVGSSSNSQRPNGLTAETSRIYEPSFVLTFPALDPELIHVIDTGFLYDYRKPTLGVLSASREPAGGLEERRRDLLAYHAFELDLEQKARTPLLRIGGLPNNLFQIKPLPQPVGGVLLLGANEIFHVDQAGKVTVVAVNEFASKQSEFALTDQGDLDLKLEGSTVVFLPGSTTGDLLLSLRTGALAVLSFRQDGRSVSGLTVKMIETSQGGKITNGASVCATVVDKTTLFVGGDYTNSLLLHCATKGVQVSRKKSRADALGVDEDALSDGDLEGDDDDDIDEDLYQTSNGLATTNGHATSVNVSSITISVMDVLPNFASHGQAIIAPVAAPPLANAIKHASQCLVLPCGSDESGALTLLSEEVVPYDCEPCDIPTVKRAWSVSSDGQDYIFTSGRDSGSGREVSNIYKHDSEGTKIINDSDLDREVEALHVHYLSYGKRFVQVTRNELRVLDATLSLSQIIPMMDENTEEELQIVHTSFVDPYLLVIRNNGSAVVFRTVANGDYEEQEHMDDFEAYTFWVAGCLYKSPTAEFPTICLVDGKGRLHAFDVNVPQAEPIKFEALALSPFVLTPDSSARRQAVRDDIVEILLTDLGGDGQLDPFLMVRTKTLEVTIYQPFHTTSERVSFTDGLRWLKIVSLPLQPLYHPLDVGSTKMVPDSGRVFVGGSRPLMISKDATSLPTWVYMSGEGLLHFSVGNKPGMEDRMLTVDTEGKLRFYRLPDDYCYAGPGWVAKTVPVGEHVFSVCHQEETQTFVLGVGEPVKFDLPADDHHAEWTQDQTQLKAKVYDGSIRLMDATTYTLIDQYLLESDEAALCVATCKMEISEITEDRKELVVAATAITRGEDLATNGCIYVFEIVSVVPQPDRPETRHKLKLLVREEVRGAVTALTPLVRKGLVVEAQGQKCMVRGLKEDNTLLPIAFMDMSCHIQSLKALRGTEMMLMADRAKGVWFFGYSEEPYKMTLFGKSRTKLEIEAADFLPFENRLFVLIIDPDSKLQVLEYNPERESFPPTWLEPGNLDINADMDEIDPESLQGQRLLHRNTFTTGHPVASLVSILRRARNALEDDDGDLDMSIDEERSSSSTVITTTKTGAIGMISCVNEDLYRSLAALQTLITTTVPHPCGLNPRGYRAVESEGFGSRGILDGNILCMYHNLSAQRRYEAQNRIGSEPDQIKFDLLDIADPGFSDYKRVH